MGAALLQGPWRQLLLGMAQAWGQLTSPSQSTHLGLAQTPLCLMQQRVVESYREWTKLADHLFIFCVL